MESRDKLGPTRYSPIRMAAEQEGALKDFVSEQKHRVLVEKIHCVALTLAFAIVGSFHPSLVSGFINYSPFQRLFLNRPLAIGCVE